MERVVLRLDAAEVVLSMRNLVGRILDSCIVLLQLRFELRDLEHREDLAGFHAAPVIHVQRLDKARLLGVNVDFLKRHQLGRHGEVSAERFLAHLGDSHRNPPGG
jgi:hypothetical protein